MFLRVDLGGRTHPGNGCVRGGVSDFTPNFSKNRRWSGPVVSCVVRACVCLTRCLNAARATCDMRERVFVWPKSHRKTVCAHMPLDTIFLNFFFSVSFFSKLFDFSIFSFFPLLFQTSFSSKVTFFSFSNKKNSPFL